MKKQILVTMLFVITILSILFLGMNRIEKINNGEMTLVNQNQMDR